MYAYQSCVSYFNPKSLLSSPCDVEPCTCIRRRRENGLSEGGG